MTETCSLGVVRAKGSPGAGIETKGELTPERYAELLDDISLVVSLVRRQSFVVMVENYLRYLDTAAKHEAANPASKGVSPLHPGGITHEFITAMTNWLLTVRLYLDHTERKIKHTFGKDSNEVADFKEATAREYDADDLQLSLHVQAEELRSALRPAWIEPQLRGRSCTG